MKNHRPENGPVRKNDVRSTRDLAARTRQQPLVKAPQEPTNGRRRGQEPVDCWLPKDAEQRKQIDLAEAGRVVISAGGAHSQGGRLLGLTHTVMNQTQGYAIFDLTIDVDGVGALTGVTELPRTKPQQTTFSSVGRGTPHPDLPKAMSAADEQQFFAEQVAKTTITFRLNDRTWRRLGTADPELIKGVYEPDYQ